RWRMATSGPELVDTVEPYMNRAGIAAVNLAGTMNLSQSPRPGTRTACAGQTIHKRVRKRRSQKPATLLQSGRYNITEASFMVGIHSTTYFRQCFKEEFGLLPSEYLKNASESK